jgi:tetratricopeptide (TPR) repeat protein
MADSPYQSASGSGIAQAYGQGASATVNIGLKPEDVAALLQAAGAAAQAKIDQLAVDLNASRAAVLGFLKILKEDDVPLEQLTTKLTLIAQRHVDMLDRLAALEPEDIEAQGHIDEAREVLRDAASMADYDRADELLSMAEGAQVETLRRAEELAREANEAVRRLHLNTAATRAERGELSRTRLDYLQAAKHFREAAELVSGDDPRLRLNYLVRSAGALYSHGTEKGDMAVLARAIETYREVLEDEASRQEPLSWAGTQNNLGNALRSIAERESGIAHLEEGVMAFRAALGEYTREAMPEQWAATQANLGSALAILGERSRSTASLEEAVIVFREALSELPKEEQARAWGMAQNNLGNALRSLGELESGTANLEESRNAYHAALGVYDRQREPFEWGMSQNNLGIVFRRLGVRLNDTGLMEEGANAYREALSAYSVERQPLRWSLTKYNLGNLLVEMEEREPSEGRLEEAVAAYRAALSIQTRERLPLDWAMTQNNLGNALRMLGEREPGTTHLKEAETAYRAALTVYDRRREPVDWARSQGNLGSTLWTMGERESGAERMGLLNEARSAIELTWQGYREGGMPEFDDWFEGRLKTIDAVIARRSAAKE